MGGAAPDFSGFQYSGPPPPDPTQNQPADFSSFGPPITSTNLGSFAGGPPQGSTAALENQVGPAQQALGNALQNQQTQPQGQPGQQTGQQSGQQQQPQFQDPLGPVLESLAQRHAELSAQAQ